MYSESLKSYLSDYNSPSYSESNVENTYYRKLCKGSQAGISCNESKREYKTKILPECVKKRVKNKWKETLNKLSYSPFDWDRQEDDLSKDIANDEREEMQRTIVEKKNKSHTTLQNKDVKKIYQKRCQKTKELFLLKRKDC